MSRLSVSLSPEISEAYERASQVSDLPKSALINRAIKTWVTSGAMDAFVRSFDTTAATTAATSTSPIVLAQSPTPTPSAAPVSTPLVTVSEPIPPETKPETKSKPAEKLDEFGKVIPKKGTLERIAYDDERLRSQAKPITVRGEKDEKRVGEKQLAKVDGMFCYKYESKDKFEYGVTFQDLVTYLEDHNPYGHDIDLDRDARPLVLKCNMEDWTIQKSSLRALVAHFSCRLGDTPYTQMTGWINDFILQE